tara:strand:+ start:1203 stop:1901 length:699 start_codon:yes stop_codon:yes gene_type:complete
VNVGIKMKKQIIALGTLILAACGQGKQLPVQDYQVPPTPDWATSDWYQYPDRTPSPDKGMDKSCCFPLETMDNNGNKKVLLKEVCKVGNKHYFQDPLNKTYHQVHLEEPKTKGEFPIKPKDYFVVKGQRVLLKDAIVMNDVFRYIRTNKDTVEFSLVKDGQEHTSFATDIIWNTKTGLFGIPDKGGLYRGGMKDVLVGGYLKDKQKDTPINTDLDMSGIVGGGLVGVVGGCK